jgi:Transposase DDE domain
MSLLWQLINRVTAGDIVLGDRYYGCYLLLAGLPMRGADGCFRLPVGRQESFASGQSLGRDDWLQDWDKPRRPKWIDPDEWAKLPEQIQVRVLRFRVARRGWRTKEVYLVTTLLDAEAYPASELAALYLARWNGELDIRSVKQTLGMKMLSCKTPAMVQAEVWTHLLGYNLTRCVMAQAALDKGLCPRQLSFAGAVQTLDAFRWLLCCGDEDSELLGRLLATALATHRVGNRPDRYEPREIKHRQRKYPELKKSREQRREELAHEGDEQAEKGRKGGGKNRPSGRVW